jgi:hypothetical protein
MGLTAPAPDPTAGGDPTQGGGAAPGPGPGQSSQLIQQVQALLAQIMQNEPEPAIQRAVGSMLQMTDDLSKVLGRDDQQDMTSGLNTPGGAVAPGGGGLGGPDLSGGTQSSEGPATSPTTFGGANKAAMANFGEKGHFSKSGSKGEALQTSKTKNRLKGGKS